MNNAVIYLDESGDLGWKLDAEYRKGGSSRYLTISAIIAASNKKHLPARFIRKIYQKHNWFPEKEKKWALMSIQEKMNFSKMALNFTHVHQDIFYKSITVYKPNVHAHIREDGNKLYNYMIGLMLLEELVRFDEVDFIYDARSLKVQSGNSLPDYLQTKLWFEMSAQTKIKSCPRDSKSEIGLQFADMLSGCVQQHFEDKKSAEFLLLKRYIKYRRLYFS